MKPSTKAALLSGLLFPGLGHLYLKKYLVGGTLIGITVVALYYFTVGIFKYAMDISRQILGGEVAPDLVSITAEVHARVNSSDNQLLSIATYTVALCWIIGIVDAWRLGNTTNKINNQLNESNNGL